VGADLLRHPVVGVVDLGAHARGAQARDDLVEVGANSSATGMPTTCTGASHTGNAPA
jgi:hypothetical protein